MSAATAPYGRLTTQTDGSGVKTGLSPHTEPQANLMRLLSKKDHPHNPKRVKHLPTYDSSLYGNPITYDTICQYAPIIHDGRHFKAVK